jgi:3-dehydro-4-phosphotetronate decarboxylase
MQADEARLRADICRWGRSMFDRGLTPGASGNLSARLEDGYLVTPTNACLGFLEPERLAKLDGEGRHVSGDPPTKEVPLHKAMYDARPNAGGVVHLHSTWATALSCLRDLDPDNALPPITPYVVMRVGRVPVIPYLRPGSPDMREPVLAAAREHAAILLANHGPVVAAPSFEAAVFAAEEIEEAAKLHFITAGVAVRTLSPAQIAELEASFRLR